MRLFSSWHPQFLLSWLLFLGVQLLSPESLHELYWRLSVALVNPFSTFSDTEPTKFPLGLTLVPPLGKSSSLCARGLVAEEQRPTMRVSKELFLPQGTSRQPLLNWSPLFRHFFEIDALATTLHKNLLVDPHDYLLED